MVRVGTRPRWQRILFLECICVDYKREIAIEGYMVVVLVLTFPIWCWYFLPSALGFLRQTVRRWIEERRRRPFGGLNIAKKNAVRREDGLGWFRGGRRSLSPNVTPIEQAHGHAVTESPLLRLPEELRREIFLHLVRPEDEITICQFDKQRTLVAMPTFIWKHAHVDAREPGERWMALQHFLHTGIIRPGYPLEYLCENMLPLAKVNRRMYKEIIPLLYGENVFHFHPVHQARCSGSLEHFLAFTHAIPTERFQDLRHLHLRANLEFKYWPKKQAYLLQHDGEYKWSRVCDALRRMPNLVTLHILITARYWTGYRNWNRRRPVEGPQPENQVLRQLIGVRAKKKCVVEVPWVRCAVGELPGAQFCVTEENDAVDPADQSMRPSG